MISADGPPHTNFVFRNNVVLQGPYGIKGVGLGPGMPTLEALFPGARIDGNVFIGGRAAPYPSGNAIVGGV